MEAWENRLEAQGLGRHAKIVKNAIIQAVEYNNFDYAKSLYQLRTDVDWPVTVDEFIDSEEFLGNSIKIWPRLKDELRIIAPDLLTGAQPITEVLNRSTIGTGKSEIGKVLLLYHMYFLCCFQTPQLLYPDLNKHTTILFVMQSVRDYITRRVLYEPARDMFTDMTWVKKNILWDKDKESTLILENKVGLVPMLASAGAIIGQAVIGGHIDEANFMEVVMESKRTAGVAGQGGLYDQAEETYSAMSRRRRSRFITKGPNPGCIYVSSSVNYKADFLDKRIDKVRAEKPENVKHVHIIDFRQVDVRPNTFSGQTFKFLVGTDEYEPKILENGEIEGRDYPTGALVEDVPIEFVDDFRHDPDKAQRDTLGLSSSAIHRFISQVSKIVNASVMGREYGLRSFLDKDNVVLAEQKLRDPDSLGLPVVQVDKLPKDRSAKRYVHVDLAISGDRCGIAMVKVGGYTNIARGGVIEMLPTYIVEMAVSSEP
ncbi:MAG TPA: hypothetical protein VN081_04390, partial [Dongiaceae bacterium]|nr:hypothetical protein [Dongiaceae bacterium]